MVDYEYIFFSHPIPHSNGNTVKVDCTPTDMLVTFSFGSPFEGRVYATGNAQACFEMGNRQTSLRLRIPLGATCGTQEEVSVLG